MFAEKFEIALCLIAGLVVLVAGIITNLEFSAILIRLIIVIVAFYIIGLIAKAYLRKKVLFEPSQQDEDLQTENNTETKAAEAQQIQKDEAS